MYDAMSSDINAWVLRFQPRSRAGLRLFCFPYAGGGSALYRTWSNDLSEQIEVGAIQLPGRESRLREVPITQLSVLVETLAEVLLPLLDRPFAFFGHSMGALIAFEVARHLRTCYNLSPAHLFVSGRRAPQLPNPRKSLHNLSDAELVMSLQSRYNGIPQAVLNEPELLQFFLPVLRADLVLLETATYTSAAPLTCQVTAMGGQQDENASQEELLAWREQTVSAFNLHMFPGDHFYLRHVQPQLTQVIAQALHLNGSKRS